MIMMSTKDMVIRIIAEVLEVPGSEITLEAGIGDFPKWDSLGNMSILQEIQDELEIEFEPEEMIDLEDVGDIIALAEKRISEK